MSYFFTQLEQEAQRLGFDQIGFSDIILSDAAQALQDWLQAGFHAEMDYMHRHGSKRYHPEELVTGTISILSVRMSYHYEAQTAQETLNNPDLAYIARYALGRDYHRLMRSRLKQLAAWLRTQTSELNYRVFCDSAPVMERAIAEKAGLGFFGKNTMLIDPKAGSFFFIGEIYLDQSYHHLLDPHEQKKPIQNHCGRCQKCLDICPTQAFPAPFQLDARRCIAYLTIEHHGIIPIELRPLIGNRVFGCDDCQMVCPWNRFATASKMIDFLPRHQLDQITLLSLFQWDEATFLQRTEGSPIRRIGYQRFLRNLAIGLGNGTPSAAVITALYQRLDCVDEIVNEHIRWAIERITTQT